MTQVILLTLPYSFKKKKYIIKKKLIFNTDVSIYNDYKLKRANFSIKLEPLINIKNATMKVAFYYNSLTLLLLFTSAIN